MTVKINKEGIVSDKITTSSGEKYLTTNDIQNIQGGSGVVDGRNYYTGNDNISEVLNDIFIFSDNTDSVGLSTLIISGDSQNNGMFANSSITSFTCDLPKLISGDYMFYDTPLESYVSYTQNLTNAVSMFEECDNLSEVITDLSSIKNGKNMFRNCSSLKLGKIDLSSLEDAEGMFYGCKLDGETVASIIDTINANEQTPRIDIGVTIDGLKSFYDNACYISFDDFVHEYEGREYHVYINEPIEKVEDLGYNYIQYDDDGAMIDSIPEEVWSSIEDTSGFFINNMTITSFDHNLPKVKRACGMFNNVRTLTSFNGDVQNLENAAGMFQYSGLLKFNKPLRNCLVLDYAFSNTPITSFTSDCGKLISATGAFVHCTSLQQCQFGNLNNLKYGNSMFYGCTLLNSFSYELPELIDGSSMFSKSALTSFVQQLPKLQKGVSMFSESSITSFDSDLPEMVDGSNMFSKCQKLQTVNINAPKMKYSDNILANCTGLTSAIINAPEMISGDNMFFGSTSMTTVELNAPKLINAYRAFSGCSNLTTFSGDLSSLKEGCDMFYKSKLDGASVANIYNTIPNITVPNSTYALDYVGKLSIGIGSVYSSTASTNKTRLNTFAVAAGFADWASLKQAFVDKGWDVTWYYSASDKIIEV